MKKFISAIASVLLFSLVIGCGEKPPVEEVSTSTEVSVDASTDETVSTSTETVTSETVVSDEPQQEEKVSVLESAPTVYLKDIYAEHGLKVGTCLTTSMLSNDKYVKLIKEQYNSITMENSMKPDYIFNKTQSIETGELVVELNSDAKRMLKWAKENDFSVRGHTLVWYSQTPKWIFYEGFDVKNELASRETMLSRMESMIKQMFEVLKAEDYIDLFYAYDIVNEAWMENGSMRDCLWKKTIGDDYLWYAFYYADKYAPESIDLYYNDYNEQYKYSTLVKFVDTLKDDKGNYLIDGIGLQAHLYTQDDLFGYFRAIDELAKTGLKLEMTELDVCLGSWQNKLPATDENFMKQGIFYYKLIEGLFERIDNGTLNMDSITFWGFLDPLSWRSTQRPLLFDGGRNPKYAFYGAAQLKDYAGYEY